MRDRFVELICLSKSGAKHFALALSVIIGSSEKSFKLPMRATAITLDSMQIFQRQKQANVSVGLWMRWKKREICSWCNCGYLTGSASKRKYVGAGFRPKQRLRRYTNAIGSSCATPKDEITTDQPQANKALHPTAYSLRSASFLGFASGFRRRVSLFVLLLRATLLWPKVVT